MVGESCREVFLEIDFEKILKISHENILPGNPIKLQSQDYIFNDKRTLRRCFSKKFTNFL